MHIARVIQIIRAVLEYLPYEFYEDTRDYHNIVSSKMFTEPLRNTMYWVTSESGGYVSRNSPLYTDILYSLEHKLGHYCNITTNADREFTIHMETPVFKGSHFINISCILDQTMSKHPLSSGPYGIRIEPDNFPVSEEERDYFSSIAIRQTVWEGYGSTALERQKTINDLVNPILISG